MTSRNPQVFVWCHLPGDTEPTLCGQLDVDTSAGGTRAGVPSFVYGKRYLENVHALPIDPFCLPLRAQPFSDTSVSGRGMDLFGVFGDALPGTWGRFVIDRRHGTQPSPTGYLLSSQDDHVGNLSFSLDKDARLAPRLLNGLDRLDDAWKVIRGLEAGTPVPPELEDQVLPNTGLGGAKPKLTLVDRTTQWLVKFPSRTDDPRFSAIRAEAALGDLAGLCGIKAAQTQLAPLRADFNETMIDPVALLVRRFDRTAAIGGGWLRDAYVSARTVIQSIAPLRGQQFMGTYNQLAFQLQRWSSNPLTDRHELFRRLVFNCCVSNTDDHDRNHGMLADELGHLYRLAPAFDIVPRIHGTRRRLQAMALGDFGAEATLDNLISACSSFDLDEQAARSTVDWIEATVADNWRRCLLNRGMDKREIDGLAGCFRPLTANWGTPGH